MTDETIRYDYKGAWEGPTMRNFTPCGHQVQKTFDLYGESIRRGECGFPERHKGPHAVVYYEAVNYANAEKPNCSTSSRLFLEKS